MSLADYRALLSEVQKQSLSENYTAECISQIVASEMGTNWTCGLKNSNESLQKAVALGRIAERILKSIEEAKKPEEEKKEIGKPLFDQKWDANNYDEVKIDKGSIKYVKQGGLHRTDGPALIWNDGLEEYFLKGERHTKHSHAHEVKRLFQ